MIDFVCGCWSLEQEAQGKQRMVTSTKAAVKGLVFVTKTRKVSAKRWSGKNGNMKRGKSGKPTTRVKVPGKEGNSDGAASSAIVGKGIGQSLNTTLLRWPIMFVSQLLG